MFVRLPTENTCKRLTSRTPQSFATQNPAPLIKGSLRQHHKKITFQRLQNTTTNDLPVPIEGLDFNINQRFDRDFIDERDFPQQTL